MFFPPSHKGLRPVTEGVKASAGSWLLAAFGRAGKSPRLFGSAEQRLGLVDAFLLLERRITVSDDAGAGLHIHGAVLDQRGAQHDAGIHLAGRREIADAAGIEPALFLLELVDDLHGADLGRARHGAGRKSRGQRIERVVLDALAAEFPAGTV